MKLRRHGLLATALLVVSTTLLRSAPGDEHWDTRFGWPGVPEWVFGMRAIDEKLYVGGFPTATGATNSGVRMWNGSRWSTIADVQGSLALVYDFAMLDGQLYVGGIFNAVNGVRATGLARWDGQSWGPVGGFEGAVFVLKSDGVNLYVGGTFTNAGGVVATNIAKWDGAQWLAFGDGLGDGSLGPDGVNAIELAGGVLYAGGYFTMSGSRLVPYLARWSGSAWETVGGGVDNAVNCLVVNGSDLYVGGNFVSAGGATVNRIARWNGNAWSGIGSGFTNSVSSIAIQGTTVYAGGSFRGVSGMPALRIAQWNGIAWSALGGGMNDAVQKLDIPGTNLCAGGRFSIAGTALVGQVGLWDGAEWHALSDAPNMGTDTFVQAVATDGTNLYAGGFFGLAGQTAASRIARFDGTKWSAMGSGMRGPTSSSNVVRAIAIRGSEVFAGGAFTNAGGVSASNIARWNGSSWSHMRGGVSGTVQAIDTTATDVYVGGSFTNAGGSSISNIARWNGATWSALGSGLSGGTVSAVLVDGDNVYAGGTFTLAGGATANRIAKWNGNTWEALGSGAENGVSGGSVFVILVHSNDVYVGGSFTAAGSVTASRIARWNGSAWSNLGGGIAGGNRDIRGLAWANGKLYASGSFTNMSGVNASSIAMWDGTNWTAVGQGLYHYTGSPRGSAMHASGNDIYVGGIFYAAGGKPSFYVAHWNETVDFRPSLRLAEFARTPAGVFQMRIEANGIPGYVVDRTTDFQTWIPVYTNSETAVFQDPTAPGSRAFYRAHEPVQ
jgi:hypothetical protein